MLLFPDILRCLWLKDKSLFFSFSWLTTIFMFNSVCFWSYRLNKDSVHIYVLKLTVGLVIRTHAHTVVISMALGNGSEELTYFNFNIGEHSAWFQIWQWSLREDTRNGYEKIHLCAQKILYIFSQIEVTIQDRYRPKQYDSFLHVIMINVHAMYELDVHTLFKR